MSKMLEIWTLIQVNGGNISLALLSIVAAAEAVVRLTPTKKDDGAVQRLGGWIKKTLDFLKLPNSKK